MDDTIIMEVKIISKLLATDETIFISLSYELGVVVLIAEVYFIEAYQYLLKATTSAVLGEGHHYWDSIKLGQMLEVLSSQVTYCIRCLLLAC